MTQQIVYVKDGKGAFLFSVAYFAITTAVAAFMVAFLRADFGPSQISVFAPLIFWSIVMYYLPFAIAVYRDVGASKCLCIFLLNTFIAWSGLGWIITFCVACTMQSQMQIIVTGDEQC